MKKYSDANRSNWDAWAALHVESDFYDVAGFKEGRTTLNRLELEELGNVDGKSLLHLQCHFGLDTLSFARLGAEVTGVDYSAEAIANARRLNDEVRLNATFIHSDIYELPHSLNGEFDIVFTSYGVLCWLPDRKRWGQTIARCLKPGGIFYMREGHPIVWALDYERDDEEIVVRYPYFQQAEPSSWSEDSTYGGDGVIASPELFVWNHGMAEVLQALIDADLRIDRVEEYDSLEWEAGPVKELGGDGRYQLREGRERLPVMWSVLATKPDM